MQFKGTKTYISTEDLSLAVNASVNLEKPLLIKGEPGTGKTMLAEEIASALKVPLIEWNIKSTTKAQQGLYEYDAVTRLRDSQLGDERVKDISNYIDKGKLWEAFQSDERVVLLIDEIDKADIEFPNDLLQELDRETMKKIIKVHHPKIKEKLVKEALDIFFDVRKVPGIKKKPSTSELVDWLKLLMADDLPDEILINRDPSKAIPPLYGALIKNEQDVQLLERLAFMTRRESNN